MTESDPVCPECGLHFPKSEVVCPVHNKPLVDAESVSAEATSSRDWMPGIAWMSVFAIVVVAVLLLAANAHHLNPANEFHLFVHFEDGEGLEVGDKVFIRNNNAGRIVDTQFFGRAVDAEIAVRPDAVGLLRTTTVFYPAFESLREMKNKCIVVWTPADEPGEPLQAGQKVAAKPNLGAHRWKQLMEYIESFRASQSQ